MAIQQSMGQQYFQDTNLIMICMMGPRRGTGTGEGNKTPPPGEKAVTNPILLEMVGREVRYENTLRNKPTHLELFRCVSWEERREGSAGSPTSIC